MEQRNLIELLMVALMFIVVIGLLIRTIFLKKGIGARTIQFTCVLFIIPTILILSFENIINGETVGTLIGGLAGYVLSGISNYDNPSKEKES